MVSHVVSCLEHPSRYYFDPGVIHDCVCLSVCIVLLYVRKQHDHVFTALILDTPTVHSLLLAVRIDYYVSLGRAVTEYR